MTFAGWSQIALALALVVAAPCRSALSSPACSREKGRF